MPHLHIFSAGISLYGMTLNRHIRFGIYSFLVFSIISCKSVEQTDFNWTAYQSKLQDWKSERISNLKKPFGYLSLTGLYWLDEGIHTFGSGEANDLQFPEEFVEKLGTVNKDGDKLSIVASDPGYFTIDSKNARQAELKSDQEGDATMMNWKSYFWYVIKRGDRYAIRLKDTLSEDRLNFKSIPSFPASAEWLKEAKFIPAEKGLTIPITNVIGITYDSKYMGTLEFKHEDEEYSFQCTDGGNNTLFIVFADYSNGKDTYGGGRFLHVPIPDEGQFVVLDFNKAENPICAFSDFATCPLPPKENHLPFLVNAGEKKPR